MSSYMQLMIFVVLEKPLNHQHIPAHYSSHLPVHIQESFCGIKVGNLVFGFSSTKFNICIYCGKFFWKMHTSAIIINVTLWHFRSKEPKRIHKPKYMDTTKCTLVYIYADAYLGNSTHQQCITLWFKNEAFDLVADTSWLLI